MAACLIGRTEEGIGFFVEEYVVPWSPAPPQGDVAALPRGTRALATVPAPRRHDRTSVN